MATRSPAWTPARRIAFPSALAQYDKSLAIDPNHGQTLFNMGIVRRDGKQDLKGAIAAWERLLAASPGYAERSKVEQVLAQARQSVAQPGSGGLDAAAVNSKTANVNASRRRSGEVSNWWRFA